MTGQFYEPQARDLIACDDGVHYVLLDRASDFCNWVMRRHPDGPLVSVRKATDHELAHAKARQHLRAGVAMLQGDAPEQRTPAPACHPDDQDEIYRIHRAFIALDEPINEQVMAFQDASYALGLKRGQAREAALQQRLNETDQHLDNATAVLRAVYNRGHVSHYGMTKIEDFFSQLTKDSPEVGS